MTDILAALLDACERTPDAPAMTLGRRTLSFGRLRERVLGTAAALADRGLVPGDRVLFSVRPGIEGICLALGVIAAGGTIVFADPGAGEAMFRARAGLAAPKWVAAESVLYAASSGPFRGIARRRGLELPDYSTVVPDARHLYSGPWLPGVPRRGTSALTTARRP
jgi:acyl-CoA synthetase (AMP-forming)/AMP-acid ligase II